MTKFADAFTHIASAVARWTGRPLAFLSCVAIVVVWGATGPIFHYSDTWQLVINTGTTIVTFLMVFLIQNTQNRDNAALQAKLDELIRVSKAKNEFIGIEHLSDKELEEILAECEKNRPNVVRAAEARASREQKGEIESSRKRATASASGPAGKSPGRSRAAAPRRKA
jgi:low affinity Fe/Cu permease